MSYKEESSIDNGRNLIGYADSPPHPRWPGQARLAVQFVLNYEEGGENCVLYGDETAETFLSEIIDAPRIVGQRHMSMESIYEYGSRAGAWRLLRLFRKYNLPITLFAVASAMARNPGVIEAAMKDGHEICSHGFRWIDYQSVPIHIEREHLERAIEIHKKITGERPLGWYTGRTSPNTRNLVIGEGGFLYDADDYNDDLPFWINTPHQPHLVIPYTLDANDMRFVTVQGFNTAEHFFSYLRDTFDVLYEEGKEAPKMMSVGLHCRLAGRPGRLTAVENFIKHIIRYSDIWICRRIDIANHWQMTFPLKTQVPCR